jgi:predicted nucleic acid-binding OB-fold protein
MNKIVIKIYFFIILSMLSCSSLQETPGQIANVIEKSTGETIIPRNSNNIYIYPFKNKTTRQDLEDKMMMSIRNKISLEGRLALVSDVKSAELSLECIVKKYIIEFIEFRDIGRPVRMRLKIFISAKLYDIKKEKVIFFDQEMQSFKIYSDVLSPVETEDQALEFVINNLTDRIMEKVKTGWDTKYKFPEEKN